MVESFIIIVLIVLLIAVDLEVEASSPGQISLLFFLVMRLVCLFYLVRFLQAVLVLCFIVAGVVW